MKKRTIRASEIGTYLFCQRAWWYQIKGEESENQLEMAGGSVYHHQHGKLVFKSILIRMAGWLFLLLAIVFFVSWLTQLALQ